MASLVRRRRTKKRRTTKKRTTAKRRSNPRKSAKRSAAAKKAAATRKRKAAARSAAAKKAARTRKRRSNPTKRRASARRAAPTRRRRRRRNPAKTAAKKTTAKRTTKRKTTKKKGGSAHYRALQREAKRLGLKASGTTGQLEAKLARYKTGVGSRSAGKKRRRLKRVARRMMKSPKVIGMRAIARKKLPKRKGKARKQARARRAVARAYVSAKRVQHGRLTGRITGQAARDAKALGLMKVNPSMKSIAKGLGDIAMLAIPTAGGAVLGFTLGLKVGSRIKSEIAKSPTLSKMPKMITNNVVPLTTLGIAAAAWFGLKLSKKTQKWSGLVGVGLAGAGGIQLLITSELGQKLLAKMGIKISITAINGDGTAVVSDSGAPAGAQTNGLGSYVVVPGYTGGLGQISPALPPAALGEYLPMNDKEWYGRFAGLGQHGLAVDPRLAGMGEYLKSTFPVHVASPGDNQYVDASLSGVFDGEGIFQGIGGAPDYVLQETPGGAELSIGDAGIFGGDSVL